MANIVGANDSREKDDGRDESEVLPQLRGKRHVEDFSDFLLCGKVLQSENEQAEPLEEELEGVE